MTRRAGGPARRTRTMGLLWFAVSAGACGAEGPTALETKPTKTTSAQRVAPATPSDTDSLGPHPVDTDPEWVALRDGLPSFVVGPVAEAIRDAKTLYAGGDAEGTAAAMQTARGRLAAARLSRDDDPARGQLADAIANLGRVARRLREARPVTRAEVDGALWTAYAADFEHVRSHEDRARHLSRAAVELRRAERAARDGNRTTVRAAANRARAILVSEVARRDSAGRNSLARDVETLANRVLNPARLAAVARSVERMSRARRQTTGRPHRRPRPAVSAAPRWTRRRPTPMLRP